MAEADRFGRVLEQLYKATGQSITYVDVRKQTELAHRV